MRQTSIKINKVLLYSHFINLLSLYFGERLNDVCISSNGKFPSYTWRKKYTLLLDDHDVCFVQAKLEFYSANSLKQQSTDRHVAPLGHSLLIPSQLFVFPIR